MRTSTRIAIGFAAACLMLAACKEDATPEKSEQASSRRAAAPKFHTPGDVRSEAGDVETADGYRVIRARTKSGDVTSIRVKPPKGWDIMAAPTEPDPRGGEFGLKEALEGLGKKGELAARIETDMGSLYCDLHLDKAPKTVANFVGLARGLREFWDSEKLAWTTRKYYDGTEFHRVIPGYIIQGGDHTGSGRGGIGYTIEDEIHPSLKHDRAGQLCMASRGPNTDSNEAQFFITDGPAPKLDGSYTIFGQCAPTGLVSRIARVPQKDKNRPITPVTIEQVEIKRVKGGAEAWMPEGAAAQHRMPARKSPVPEGRALEVDSTGKPVSR